jgi:1-acyl-sn-glycerol-3-phosphate acyltransferase
MMRGRTDRLHAEASDYFASTREWRAVKRTDHYWLRLPGTGLWFLVFGLVTFVLGFVVLPVIRLVTPDRSRRQLRSRTVLGAGMRFFIHGVNVTRCVDYEFIGREKLGRPGQLIVANHPTLIDVCFLLGFTATASCIVKAGHFRNLITRGAVTGAGYIPNAPTGDMIHAAEAALQAGETLLMFPEGTRTVPGKPMALQRGAANVALRAARVLTPVYISCEPSTLSKNLPWYRIPHSRPKWTLRVGDDIDLAAYRGSPVPIASRRLHADLAGLFAGATQVRD